MAKIKKPQVPKKTTKKSAQNKLPGDARHTKLVSELTVLLSRAARSGSQALNEDRLDSYWRSGKKLSRLPEPNAAYWTRLARDLKISATLLYRAHGFFKTWRNSLTADAKKIPWRHHIVLIGIKSERERDFYVKTVLEKNWSRDTLARAYKKDFFAVISDIEPGKGLARNHDPFHLYKAQVDAVVDGDTLDVSIDLGYKSWTKQRLRLRGVNATELSRPDAPSPDPERAAKAKSFIIERLSNLPFVVLHSHKTDKYGRYVVDIFYHPHLDDKRDVAANGFFLNEELIQAGLVDAVDV